MTDDLATTDGTTTHDLLLEVDGIDLRFGGLQVLDGVSFTVRRAEILALIGPNGAGKTSLFNVLTRTYRSTGGSVTLHTDDGPVDILRSRADRLVELGIARTFQNLQLIPELTVLDNVLVGRHHLMRTGTLRDLFWWGWSAREERAHRLIARDTLDLLGVASWAERPVRTVPYGVRKTVELARALATRPRLLLLDEPAAGLDDKETEAMAATLRMLRASGTCTPVLIEHDVGMVMRTADRIVALNFGHVLTEGAATEVSRHPDVIAAYLGSGPESDHSAQ